MRKVFFHGFELIVYDSVYEPFEDSYLLAENVRVMPGTSALDIGCGCGIQAINLLRQGAIVTATDINKYALKNTEENIKRLGFSSNAKILYGDLFEPVKGKKFDCIVFNPPYLPNNGKEDKALDGGKKGNELLFRFIEHLPRFLKKNGSAYFIQSSITNEAETKQKLKYVGFKYNVLTRKHFFFEDLVVFKAFL
ncbi:MAG: methyltransferase [Candidatus Diapherotrites archaeon]|nr:methyltransferase [Candidatus Diapherotrites archaeon]